MTDERNSISSQPIKIMSKNYKEIWSVSIKEIIQDSPLKFGWLENCQYHSTVDGVMLILLPDSVISQTQTLFWPQAIEKIRQKVQSLAKEDIEIAYLNDIKITDEIESNEDLLKLVRGINVAVNKILNRLKKTQKENSNQDSNDK